MKKSFAFVLGATLVSSVGVYAYTDGTEFVSLRELNVQLPAIDAQQAAVDDFGGLGYKQLPQHRLLHNAVDGLTASAQLLPATPVKAVAREGAKPVYALMVYSGAWGDQASSQVGVYSIATDGSYTAPVEVKKHGVFVNPAFATGAGDKFYFGQQVKSYNVTTSMAVYSFNMADWSEGTLLKGDVSSAYYTASDAAYNPVNTELYGSLYNSSAAQQKWGLYRISMDGKLVFRKLAALDEPFTAMAFDADGTLYAVTADGNFIKYDILNRTANLIASGIPVSTKTTTGTIDPERRCFYYAACTESASALYEIMLADGACTKLHDFANGEEFIGMYQPNIKEASTATPGAPSGLTLTFASGALTGKVSFTAPTVTSDGKPAEGDVNYTVMAGNTKVAEGTTQYGATVTADVTLATSGDYTFTVRMSNAAGEGPIVKTSKWLGNDIPKTIASAPKVTYANGKATITWVSSTGVSGVNEGYVNSAKFTYTVERVHDGKIIASNISTRTATDTFEEPQDLTTYYYKVYTNFEGATSDPVTSAPLTLGAATPPYSISCETDASSLFTILDANKDYRTWSWSSVYKRMQVAPSTTAATDDWLFTIPFRFETGRVYKLSFETYSGAANTTQKMEVKMGKDVTPESMTTSLSDSVMLITSVEKTPTLVEYNITVNESGAYRIGFHGVADKGLSTSAYLCLRNISMGAGVVLDAPASVTELSAQPDMDGALKAKVQFTCPTKTFSGNDLTSLTSAEVRVGDKVVKTFDNPTPGSVLSADIEVEQDGLTAFSVIAINDKGQSQPVSVSTFIGLTTPAAPQPTAFREVSDGEIFVSWNPVSLDANGKNLPANSVTYNVMSLDQSLMKWGAIAEGLAGTETTMRVCAADEPQDFFTLAMAAKNDKGLSKYWALPQLPLGAPYALPYIESNAGNSLSHTFLTKKYAGDGLLVWKQANISTISGVVPADNDGGYFYLQGSAKGDKAGLISGKINLKGAVHPVLSVDYVVASNSHNKMGFNIIVDGEESLLKEWDCNGAKTAWASMHIPMDKYIGKQIQLVLWGELVDMALVVADRMELIDYPSKDMSATAIRVPEKMRPGRTADIPVTVVNKGLAQIDSYTVNLYANGNKVASKSIDTPIPFRSTAEVMFSYLASSVNSGNVAFTAEAVTDGDNIADNNTTAPANCTILESVLPAPTELTANATASSIELAWKAPVFDTVTSIETEEDCESLSSFAVTALGDWKTIDVDQSKSRAFNGLVIPQLGINSFAFMVFDNDNTQFNSTFAAHSGHKYFMAFANEAGKCDDWLISPALNGKAQTVTMWARSFNPSYPESFEILYSNGGTETTDFTLIQRFDKIGGTFIQYKAVIPAGAKYFAVRCVSEGGNMFILDDIAYQPSSEDLRVTGYNIYRNGQAVGTSAEATTWADTTAPDGSLSYAVTAVSNYGESLPSNSVSIETSALDLINADLDGSEVLYNLQGIRVDRATAAPGIYIMRRNNTSAKVVLK